MIYAHDCERCGALCDSASDLCFHCQTHLQRREIERDLREGTTNPDRPKGVREMIGTVALAILLFLAYALVGAMDYQAATGVEMAVTR